MSSLNQSINKSMPTQNDLNKITEIFFTLQLLNKIYHWSTTSYSRHMATDRFNGNMQINGKLLNKYNFANLNKGDEYNLELNDTSEVGLFKLKNDL